MTIERGAPLLHRIADVLDNAGARFALIGAAALAVHGVSRSTLDIDLLTTDRHVLEAGFWTSLASHISVDIRHGDASDPLAGVVRLREAGERDVDIVVGRGSWNDDVLTRAAPTSHGGRLIPVAGIDDLILLKLYAGGSQDRWDIDQLLARSDRDLVVAAVERHINVLPQSAREIWVQCRRHDRDEPI